VVFGWWALTKKKKKSHMIKGTKQNNSKLEKINKIV